MKIFIFGSNGMLGNYLNSYLNKKYNVIPLTRKDFDISNINISEYKKNIKKLISKNDLIINAAGVIKQRSSDNLNMLLVNSVFPNILAEIKIETGCNVIHITTDCVFNGSAGSYKEDDIHDCLDDYGKTKSLGENNINTNIRTSIIGEEIQNKVSLLEWLISQKNLKINGYSNHLWNGLTCLELSKFIEQIIINKNYWNGIRHIFSPDMATKYELSNIINQIYNLNLTINEYKTEYNCYRNLKSNYQNTIKTKIFEQIKEMKNFKL